MHLKPLTHTLLLTLALITTTTKTHADTYIWSGTTNNFSNPSAWTTPAPSPNGSPTDQLLFPIPNDSTTDSYIAAIDTSRPWNLNSLTFVGNDDATSIPTITINADANASLLFNGPNPTINILGYADSTINTPISSDSNLTINTNFSGLQINGPLSFTTTSNLTTSIFVDYQNNQAPTNLNQTTVNGSLTWVYTPTDNSPLSLSFGSGPIILNQSTFTFAFQNNSNISTTPISPPSVDLNNPIQITNYCQLGSFVQTGTLFNPSTPTLMRYTGPILLGGTLTFSHSITASNSGYDIYLSGPITLDQSTSYQPAIETYFAGNTSTHVTGNIIDDPNPSDPARQPLFLAGPTILTAPTAGLYIEGTANTYSVDTEIAFGKVFVSPNSTLGLGSVTVDPNAFLGISSFNNIAPNQKILVHGTLSLTFNQDPSPLIDSNSNGILAIDTTFSTPLNLATIGNGLMVLASTNNGTYSASTLMPNSDHIYHFDSVHSGLTTLTLLNSVLRDYDGIPSSVQFGYITLDAPNSYSGGSSILGDVYANAPGALGTGNITIGSPFINDTHVGRLYLAAPSAYAPSDQVDVYGTLAAIGSNGSIPFSNTPPILHSGSALVLGDNLTNNSDRYPDSMPINLNSSTLLLKGFGNTTETVGPINIAGLSSIVLYNSPPTLDPNSDWKLILLETILGNSPVNNYSTTLIAASLNHEEHAVAFFVPFYVTSSPFLTPSSITAPATPNGNAFQLASPPTVTNGMVAPWIQSRDIYYDYSNPTQSSSFLTFTANGFVPAAYAPLPTTGGTGTEIVDIPQDPANAPIVLSTDTSIYALRIANSITNPNTGPVTLHILSGGLIYAYPSISTGNLNVRIDPNVDFAGAEAYINTDGDPSSGGGNSLELAGIVTATHGLTKFGFGNLLLSNPHNTILGPITIHEGTLTLAALPDPASTYPITLSSLASLSFTNNTTLTRPIIITKGGSIDLYNGAISTANGKSLTIAAPITVDGFYNFVASTLLKISAPIIGSGEVTLGGNEIRIDSNISANQVNLYPSQTGRLSGNGAITSPTGLYLARGVVAPGDEPGDIGTLTFNAATELTSDAGMELDLSSSALSDRILFTNSLILQSSSLNLNFLSPPTTQTYTLLTYTSLTGTFATITGLPPNYTLSYTPTALLLTPTPEPLSLATLTLLLPTILRRRPPKKPK